MSPSPTKRHVKTKTLSRTEVIAAIFILIIGLVTAAAVTGKKMMAAGRQSKSMTQASTLASEKLEDLTRWDPNDPTVCVPTNSTSVGNLTTDVTQVTRCSGGASDTVSYFDDVTMGSARGAFSETSSGLSNGSPVYVTTTHSADGSVQTTTSMTPSASPATFHRRWTIEANFPVTGARRVTVRVTLLDRRVKPPVTFQMSQMSMVHP